MTVKEFFAYANIKIAVIEFLKQKADFEKLSAKHKKPFRAYINKHSVTAFGAPSRKKEDEEKEASSPYSDYFVSDGYNSIRCVFSEVCKEMFERRYPGSLKIYNTANMLICIMAYTLQVRTNNALYTEIHPSIPLDPLCKQVEVVLIVEDMRIVSFDRFQMKLPASV